MHFIDHLSALAKKEPDRSALVRCDAEGTIIETLSRRALLERIEDAAAWLRERGIKAGDRIALETGSSIETLIVSWAAWGSGVVTVPLDLKRDTSEQRQYKVGLSGARALINNLEQATTREPIAWVPDTAHEALILFTSGTTARPKGARLTLNNLVVNAQSIAQWLRIDASDRFLVQLPLHHINSTTFCLAALLSGASIVVPPHYSDSRFWKQAAGSKATFTSIVPSIIFDQLKRTEAFEEVRHQLVLNRIQIGSAPVVASAVQKFVERFHIPLYQGYGQTETALRVTGVPLDLSEETYAALLAENSIGTPLSWATVEIMGNDGALLDDNQDGELVVRGQAVMQGYLGGEEAFKDGWFLTGDIGYWRLVDGRKFFFLKGRKKEIIIKGGINVSPVAVENNLQKISPDIEQAYVIGVPDERYGEEIAAFIVWRASTDQAAAMRRLKLHLLRGTAQLSPYETPQYLSTLAADQLPTTSTGKVQRVLLKNTATQVLRPLQELFTTNHYRYTVVGAHSQLFAASHQLYNHCWQPLTIDAKAYTQYLSDYLTLAAVDSGGAILGQISFSCTDETLTCVSICSARFVPKPVPKVRATPSLEMVKNYLLGGHDPVMNFHARLGAELREVIPNGRPADASALGYTMRLQYPSGGGFMLDERAPSSHQLIIAVRILGDDLQVPVFALSRPGGLASFLSRAVA